MFRLMFVCGLSVIAACTAGPVPVEDNAVGLDRIQIVEEGARTVVSGLDDRGQILVTATMDVGIVPWTPDDAGETPVMVYGRKLVVAQTGRDPITHVSPGVGPLELPVPKYTPVVLAFMSQDALQYAFEGVTFASPTANAEEVAFDKNFFGYCNASPHTSCTYSRCGGGSNTCSTAANTTFEVQLVCCNGSKTNAERWCSGAPSCSNGSTYGASGCPSGTPVCPGGAWVSGQYCANTGGLVGPAGCAVAWTSSWATACGAYGWDWDYFGDGSYWVPMCTFYWY